MTSTDPAQNWPPPAGAGAYGRDLAQCYGLSSAPCLLLTEPFPSRFAITHLRCTGGSLRNLRFLPRSAAFMVTLYLKPCSVLEVVRHGERLEHHTTPADSISIEDLSQPVAFNAQDGLDCLCFYIAKPVFEEACAPFWPRGLGCAYGTQDATIAAIGAAMLPIFGSCNEAGPWFLSHIASALAIHLALTYGTPRSTRGG